MDAGTHNKVRNFLRFLFHTTAEPVGEYSAAALRYLAEVLDHVEEKDGIRADGFSASINSMIQTVALGLCQTLLLAGVSALGYIAPESTAQIVVQPDAVVNFFQFCFAVMPIIGYGGCAFLMSFYNLKKD